VLDVEQVGVPGDADEAVAVPVERLVGPHPRERRVHRVEVAVERRREQVDLGPGRRGSLDARP